MPENDIDRREIGQHDRREIGQHDRREIDQHDWREIDQHVAGASAAHQRLLAALDPPGDRGTTGVSDEMVGRPSRLPGWTVGHVLAHLALNAESFVNVIEAAERGECVRQYASEAIRDSDIERAHRRPATEHVATLRTSVYRLEGAWNRAREAWVGAGLTIGGDRLPVVEIPMRRWREVEVHTVDLGIAEMSLDSFELWSNDYVRHDLRRLEMSYRARGSMGLVGLPAVVAGRSPRERLAWMLGRLDIEGAPRGEWP